MKHMLLAMLLMAAGMGAWAQDAAPAAPQVPKGEVQAQPERPAASAQAKPEPTSEQPAASAQAKPDEAAGAPPAEQAPKKKTSGRPVAAFWFVTPGK